MNIKLIKVIYILLPINFIATRIFYELFKDVGFEMFIPSGRINFESGRGKKTSSPSFATVILHFIENGKIIKLIDKEFK